MELLKFNFRQEAGSDTLDLYIYSEVQEDYYEWSGWDNVRKVESETSADFFRKQLEAHKNVRQINLYINSMGGSVLEGYGIYCQLKRHPAQITAYVDGFACSIASVIACAADHVVAYPNSMYMLHNMMNVVYGNAEQLRKAAADLDRIMEGNRQVYLEKAGGKMNEAQLTAMLEAETWLPATECLALGLVDEIKQVGGITQQRAAEILEKSNASLKQQMLHRQMLQRMMRDTEPPAPPVGAPNDPAPQLDPEEKTKVENTLMYLFSAYQKD